MDKKKLNNEIVLCRPIVRKAKVIVIRKIIKKMKVLKTCKKESVKDKKLRKAERLFKKVQILKKLKVDDVTKFALKNNNLNAPTKKPTKNLKTLAFSSLARYDLLAKKIQAIREQVPNWETELPLLLDSIGKKKKNKKTKVSNKESNIFLKSSDEKSKDVEGSENVKLKKDKTMKKDKTIKDAVKCDDEALTDDSKIFMENETGNETFVGKREKSQSSESCSESDSESEVDNEIVNEINETEKLVKIEDPFFVGKKIIASKLLLEEEPNKMEQPQKKFDSHKFFRNSDSFNFDDKPFRKKFDSGRGRDFRDRKSFDFDGRDFRDRKGFDSDRRDFRGRNRFESDGRDFRDRKSFNFTDRPFKRKFGLENDNFKHVRDQGESETRGSLHPSWEAKRNQKTQLVKPFQGKKITFSED